MFRIFAAFCIFFCTIGVAAQDVETRQLPFNLELNRPITVNTHTKQIQGNVSFTFSETMVLEALRTEEGAVIYKAETVAADVDSIEGLPDALSSLAPLMEKLAVDAVGMEFEYSADATGYPSQLTEHKQVNRFMKKMGKDLKKWLKKFGREQKLNKQQVALMNQMADQQIAPFLTDDIEELSRMVLEEGQLMFSATGRELYVGYYTEFKGTRYFEPGQAYFYTKDSWLLDTYDEDAGEAIVTWEQTLDPEEFDGFLQRYQAVLLEQNGPERQAAIDAQVEKYRQLQLNRSATFTIDLTTGLPKSGTIVSNQEFSGEAEQQELSFTMEY